MPSTRTNSLINVDNYNTKPESVPVGVQYLRDTVSSSLWYEGWAEPQVLQNELKWLIRRTVINGSIMQMTWGISGLNLCSWNLRTTYFGSTATYVSALSMQMDGVNDTIQMPIVHQFTNTSVFSISMWLRPISLTGIQSYIGNRSSITAIGWEISQPVTNVGSIRFSLTNTNATNQLQVTTTLTNLMQINTWTHVVLTYDGSQTPGGCLIYTGGVSRALTTNVNNLTATTVTSTPLRFGSNIGTSQFYSGYINNFAVYNAVLTPAQVVEIYNLGKPNNLAQNTSSAALVSWWKLGDSDTFPVALDNVAGFNGQMINMSAGQIVAVAP